MKQPVLLSHINRGIHSVLALHVEGNSPAPPPLEANASPADPARTCCTPIYAIGTIQPRFPYIALQREWENERIALHREHAHERKDKDKIVTSELQAMYEVLKRRNDIAQEMCWIFTIKGLDLYRLDWASDAILEEEFIESLQPAKQGQPADTDVILGTKGIISECGGVALPSVRVNRTYTFNVDNWIANIIEAIDIRSGQKGSKPTKNKDGREAIARNGFERVRQIADNMGDMPQHRALNFVAVQYEPFYVTLVDAIEKNLSLTSIEARPSRLYRENQQIYDVIVTFEPNFAGAMEQYFVRIDVTTKYPMITAIENGQRPQNGMMPFFER